MNLAFLASHNGSNMQAIIDACNEGKLYSKPSLVISNNRNSMALKRAESEGIPSFCLNGKTHPEFEDLDNAICEALLSHDTDYVILAGYMKKIGPRVLKQFKGRILNIHPALLPRYGGKGMYGMNVHKAVIDAGEKESGVTVHIIDENYDTGPIVDQAKVPVLENDTPETLAERVLAKEHEFFVSVIRKIECGYLTDDYNWLQKWKKELENETVLELGCGEGIDSEILFKLSKCLTATDKRVDIIEKNLEKTPQINFQVADHSEALPFKDNTFSAVVSSLCLHYFSWEKTIEVLVEIGRVLKSGGLLIGRVNSVNDVNYGAKGYPEIENRLFLVDGKKKRFFKKQDIIELISKDWEIDTLRELQIDRYGNSKSVIEFSARKK